MVDSSQATFTPLPLVNAKSELFTSTPTSADTTVWNLAKMNDEIKNLRTRLRRAADFYKKEKLDLALAKAKLLEAEFLIDVITGK